MGLNEGRFAAAWLRVSVAPAERIVLRSDVIASPSG
jgi:hypothetical protein